ncbi:MAG: hypothetical protein AAF547_19600 [Actinomycetota bacterium]
MARSRNRLAAVLCTPLVLLAACGSDDSSDDVADSPSVESASDATDASGGEQTADQSDTDQAPAPAPTGSGLPPSVDPSVEFVVPDGWVADVLGEIGMENSQGVQLLYPVDDFDRIVEFYEEWTAAHPADFTRSDELGAVTYLAVGEITLVISIDPTYTEQGQNFVNLQVV